LDDFTASLDELVELWGLADMYQLEGLKLSCMAALERDLCKESAFEILEEAESLICPCDDLKRTCNEFLQAK
jgi:hypothetical protein